MISLLGSKQYPESFKKTLIKKGASIGANATIIAGNIIEEYSMIGAGAVVTKSTKKYEVMAGQPGQESWLCDKIRYHFKYGSDRSKNRSNILLAK